MKPKFPLALLLTLFIVFCSSDNGPVWFHEDIEKYGHASMGPLRGMKGDMWEGGSRIPFIVRAPKYFQQGRESNQMLCFTDMMATLADLLGDKNLDATDFDSHSFLPMLTKTTPKKPLRNELIVEKKKDVLYYYVRVRQTDEHLAWSSPVFFKLT